MITERTLKKWRRESLAQHKALEGWNNKSEFSDERRTLHERILRMTQELLDQHLLRKEAR